MKLPLEIRHMIYRMLLAPLAEDRSTTHFKHEFDGLSMGQGFRFEVYNINYHKRVPETDYEYYTRDVPEGQLETYQALQDEIFDKFQVPSGWVESEGSGDGVPLWRRPRYEVELQDDESIHPDCPARHDYQRGPDEDCTCNYLQMRELDFIHGLSHVTPQFTAEFGECVWENAMVVFQDPELFFVFFQDRPGILRRIKGIILELRYKHEDDFNTSGALLIKISEFVSQHFDLKLLSIRLYTDLAYSADPLVLEELDEWTTAFRGLSIREKFVVDIPGYFANDKVQQGLIELLRELWLPDSLREDERKKQEELRLPCL